jgi:hypothetical protein
MCLWFCETFCCFLLRCRDSYYPNTPNYSTRRNRNPEEGTHGLQDVGSASRGTQLEDIQPSRRQGMPQRGKSLSINPSSAPPESRARRAISTGSNMTREAARGLTSPTVSLCRRPIPPCPFYLCTIFWCYIPFRRSASFLGTTAIYP